MTFLTSPVAVHSLANVIDYPPGATYGPRVMTLYEFVWVMRGAMTWECLDAGGSVRESHRLAPGIMALAPRGLHERYVWDPVRASAHGYIHFTLPEDVDHSAWPRSRTMSERPLLAALANSLFDVGTADERAAHERSALIVGLMLEVFLGTASSGREGPIPRIVDAAVAYVRQQWLECGIRIVGIAEIAAEIGVSTGYLSRAFRERYGVGPAGALELIRLGRVAVALQRTSSRLADIARDNGFTDEYHLSKRFALAYGLPPGAYRRLQLDAEPLEPIIAARLLPLWTALLAHAEQG